MPLLLPLLLLAGEPAPLVGFVVADLVDLVGGAEARNALGRPGGGGQRIAGLRRLAIDQHPQHPGQPLCELVFAPITVPELEPGQALVFECFPAIREGFDPASPGFDGVDFVLRVDGRERLRHTQREQAWGVARVDLGDLAGRTVQLTLVTDCRASSNYDWAVWGRPRLVITGRAPDARTSIEPYLRTADLLAAPEPDRIVAVAEDGAATTLVATLDEHLDLACQLQRLGDQVPCPVPLGPEIVVGEGAHPEAHTVVRVLGRYGLPRVQFLAFEPEVRGGVTVAAGRDGAGQTRLVACPRAAAPAEIRLFDPWGGPQGTLVPGLPGPYTVAVGDLLPDRPGDELAVAAVAGGPVRLFDLAGGPLDAQLGDLPGPGTLQIRRDAERTWLVAWSPALARGWQASPAPAERRELAFDVPAGWILGPAPEPGVWWAAPPTGDRAVVRRVAAGEPTVELDLGRIENRFYYCWPAAERGWEDLPPIPAGEHVQPAVYRHLRVDAQSGGAREPDFANQDPAYWAGNAARAVPDLSQGPIPVLEPCYTHRQFQDLFARWHQAVDPATGLPTHVMLTRRNQPVRYGEFGRIDFVASTYAFGTALDRLYLHPLRAFLQAAAPEFRAHPERLAAIEPNHEHEIAVGDDYTIGDYNSANIAGFFDYLTRRYGRDPAAWRELLGIDAGERFDAPRWEDRGAWDAYDESNPLFWEWGLYNRYVINRRLAETFREALLAGFPPELIKSHQIPDLYAVGGGLSAFSDVADRITPIDYALTAGVGFGYTKYGLWYRQPHNIAQAGWESGFGLMLIGEYQALVPDADEAYAQLRYLFDHGTQQVHCMTWPDGHDRGFNRAMHQALARLAAEDPPRPGVTGGLTRFETRGDTAIAATGDGLLKSVRADGSFEGTVYTMPFHAAVAIETLAAAEAERLDGELVLAEVAEVDGGMQLEATFRASAAEAGELRFEVRGHGRPLPGLSRALAVGPTARDYRLIVRCPLPASALSLVLASRAPVALTERRVVRCVDQVVRVHRGERNGRRHAGGITFACLP